MSVLISHATTRRHAPARDIPAILANAVDRAVTVVVRPSGDAHAGGVPGTIARCDAKSLWITLSDDELPERAAGTTYSVIWWIDGVQYGFDGPGTTDPAQTGATLEFAVPDQIEIVERRRASRQPLRETSHVCLQMTSGGDNREHRASIMNVSAHGLACRLATPASDTLSVGMQLTSIFSLEGSDQTFALTGRIVNITQGGTPGQRIIGIEFTGDQISHAQQEALSAALTRGPEG